MLGKLIKYEFKATSRIFLPLLGALLLVAIISKIFSSLSFETPSAIGFALSVFMTIAIFIIAFIVTLQRFYKNLLTNEGYLMFTLPVKTDHLIWSKLLVAAIWNIVSLIVVFIAIAIMALAAFNLSEAISSIQTFFNGLGISNAQIGLFAVELVVLLIVALLSGTLMLYTCMSSSLFVNKHRILASFGAYIVLYIIGQIINGIVISVGIAIDFENYFLSLALFNQIQFVFTSIILVNLVVAVLYYFYTRFMLKNKLNLE